MTTQLTPTLNGHNPQEIEALADAIAADANQGKMSFQVSTTWVDGDRSIARVKSFGLGDRTYARDFTWMIDEPEEVGGTNAGPNPQEMILSALNACVVATFAAFCTMQGIRLETLEVHSDGVLDLRGLFGLDDTIHPGFQSATLTLVVRGDASVEQFQEVYQATIAKSPNIWNFTHSVNAISHLQVEHALSS